ncbi:MAG: rhomboid family intramembrane serine protease [Isosphaeraceae bacterium]
MRAEEFPTQTEKGLNPADRVAGRAEAPPSLLREAPASMTLGAFWVLVYVAMLWHQGAFPLGRDGQAFGAISTTTTHLFGDQTPAAIAAGQAWRALTSTFIHFSLLHMGTNLLGFILFGRMVEGWYGSGLLVAIYAVIGLLGNLLSAALKLYSGASPFRPSGGGSGVAVGLIALIAVAGWRSGSRYGRFIQVMMCALLVVMALMGRFFPMHDNLGHATGALIGALIGLAHPLLVRSGQRFRRLAGLAGLLLLAACAGAQVWADRVESRAVNDQAQLQRLGLSLFELARAEMTYRELVVRGQRAEAPVNLLTLQPTGPSTAQLRVGLLALLQSLETHQTRPRADPAASAYQQLLIFAEQAQTRPPTPGDAFAFDRAMEQVVRDLQQQILTLRARQPHSWPLARTLPRQP